MVLWLLMSLPASQPSSCKHARCPRTGCCLVIFWCPNVKRNLSAMMGLCAVLVSLYWPVSDHGIIDSRYWTVWRSTSSSSLLSPTIPAHLLPLFLHICDQVVVIPVTCLDVSLSISTPHSLICCCLFLSLPPTHSTCMHVFSLSSSSVTIQPETLSKSPVGNFGLQAAFWCQHMYARTLVPNLWDLSGSQGILLCLSQSIQALLQG